MATRFRFKLPDLYNLLCNPDKNDESDPDFMLNTLTPSYYSMQNSNSILNKTGANSLTYFIVLYAAYLRI